MTLPNDGCVGVGQDTAVMTYLFLFMWLEQRAEYYYSNDTHVYIPVVTEDSKTHQLDNICEFFRPTDNLAHKCTISLSLH